jgi:hypothetical protein
MGNILRITPVAVKRHGHPRSTTRAARRHHEEKSIMSPRERTLPSLPVRPLLLAAALVAAGPAAALDLRPEAVGVEVDLLPTVASAVAGDAGGALQAWVGADRNRLRLVGAHLHYPGGFTAAPFANRSSTVAAVLYDRFFRDDFTGPWVAAGVEYWWSRIGLESGLERGRWETAVATVGAGWVFPLWKGLYVNPWGAAHVPFSTGRVPVGATSYQPRALEAEVSVKLGWTWSLPR